VYDYVPGDLLASSDLSVDQHTRVASQIGQFTAKLVIGADSTGVVDNYVIPYLRHILLKRGVSEMPEIHDRIQYFLDNADKLKVLPLALTHIDINARNVSANWHW
jgi:hypothetical protein